MQPATDSRAHARACRFACWLQGLTGPRARLQVFKVGKKGADHGAKTDYDPTDKPITPMGGFVGYGNVNEDYVIIKARPESELC